MATQKHYDQPGSPAWHARRAGCFNAGDASALLGCHPSGVTRTKLMQALATGLEREFSDYVQEKVIDPGHQVEAVLRAAAEDVIDEDLQVIAFSLDIGLSKPLGASLDGITFMEDTIWECKSSNEALRAALPHTGRDSYERNDARNLPKGYRVQMEQQQLCSGATRTLFTVGRLNPDGTIAEERHAWYTSDPELRAELVGAWKVADAELPTFAAPAAVEKVVAEPVEALPTVAVRVEGAIVIHENFDAFEVAMREFLANRLIREPKTDQDFADLEVQIKAMKGAEAALDTAEAGWIAQIEAVSTAKRRKDMLRALVRDNRLLSEKLMASEKERRKADIVAAGVKGLADHIAALNASLGKPYMPAIPADFGGVIRGLKSLASMEDKISTELARAKAAADRVALNIQTNLTTLRELAKDHASLFADTAQLVLKAPDDCRAQVEARIATHKAEQERCAAELAERERARIRAEEEARATEAARQKNEMALQEIQGIQQQVAIATLGRAGVRKGGTIECIRETLAETEAWLIDDRFGALQGAAQAAKDKAVAEIQQLLQEHVAPLVATHRVIPAAGGGGFVAPEPLASALEQHQAPVGNVRPMPTRAPATLATPPSLRLGQICERLGFTVTADFLSSLGYPPAATQQNSKLYHESDFPNICRAIAMHVAKVGEGQKAVA